MNIVHWTTLKKGKRTAKASVASLMLPRTNLWRVNTLEKTSQGGKCFLLGIALHYHNHNSNFHNQHHHHLLGCILRAKTSFLTPGKNDQPVKWVRTNLGNFQKLTIFSWEVFPNWTEWRHLELCKRLPVCIQERGCPTGSGASHTPDPWTTCFQIPVQF